MGSRLTEFLYKENANKREPFVLFDVGCSGGVSKQWDVFGPCLHATGFDPLEAEVDRLNRSESRPHVRYEPGFIGLNAELQKDFDAYQKSLPAKAKLGHEWLDRSSSVRGAQLISYDYEKEIFNSGARVVYSSRHLSLDDYCEATSAKQVDFLKTDTDGHDIKVLMGAGRIIGGSILGAYIECSFGSSISKYANTFYNVDKFMNDRGFSLFDMELRKYTRAALPGRFQYNIFAQTENGPVNWADVLYLRDLADPNYESMFDFKITPERVIKMACLMELFGLEDCAAELIIQRADMLPYPTDQLLDLLVPVFLGAQMSYRDYIKEFASDPQAFFPSRRKSAIATPIVAGGNRQKINLHDAVSEPHWQASHSFGLEGQLLLTTNPNPWNYAAVLPISRRQGQAALEIDIEVLEGSIGVSITDATHSELRFETLLDAKGLRKIVVLPFNEGSALLVRNTSENNDRSRVSIFNVYLLTD